MGVWLALLLVHLWYAYVEMAWAGALQQFDGWDVLGSVYSAYNIEAPDGPSLGGLFLQGRFYFGLLARIVIWDYSFMGSGATAILMHTVHVVLSTFIVARQWGVGGAAGLSRTILGGLRAVIRR